MLTALTILFTYILLALPAAAIGLPWTLLRGDIGLLYRWAMWIARSGLKVGRIRVDVSGRRNIPAGRPCIFMANHLSNLDPPVLLPLLPFRAACFLKRSLLKIPILGWAMQLADFVPVDRDGTSESARKSGDFARKVLASGVHICTFPEGTRSPTGKLLPFKKGPFFLAMESGAFVVPVSIWGTEQMMPKGGLRVTPGTAHVLFHPALDPAGFSSRQQLMAAVRRAIASALPAWMQDDEMENQAESRASGLHFS
jgi:1-acyl-sn-glycerol-3-phosphate acyltransferase